MIAAFIGFLFQETERLWAEGRTVDIAKLPWMHIYIWSSRPPRTVIYRDDSANDLLFQEQIAGSLEDVQSGVPAIPVVDVQKEWRRIHPKPEKDPTPGE